MSTKFTHPKVLPYLCLTEMWERFGFYTVQGLLVLYMTQYFGLPDSDSYKILGVFTALAYISPLAGGYIANKFLGFKNSVVWGGFFLILGYALLAVPYAKTLLYPALGTIILGNGLFKPNISSLLGTQYGQDNPLRESGFTIFYIGINIGAFLAGMSSGYIKDIFGWRTSFGLASVGLIIGLITFCFGLRKLKDEGPAPLAGKYRYGFLFCCILAIFGLTFLLKIHSLSDWLLPLVGVLLFFALIYLSLQQEAEYKKKMFVLISLILSSIVFWTLFLQIFYSANLFVDRLVSKNLLGIPLTTTVFYASESIFIILLGPIFAWAWQKLSDMGKNPSPVSKFIFGIFFAGLGFAALGFSTMFPNEVGLIPPLWIFFSYLLITIGELLLSPIGLSAVTLLAPANLVGLMMGVWFVATGFGGIFAGWLAQLSNIPANIQTTTEKLAIYQNAFFDYAYLAFAIAISLYLIQFVMRRLMKP